MDTFDRKIATVIFIDKKGNVIVQDRRNYSKDGEIYGFWGGGIEEGETPEQGLRRELKEELGYEPKKVYYWKEDVFEGISRQGASYRLLIYLFLAEITPELFKAKASEGGGLVIMNFIDIKPDDFGGGTEGLSLELKEMYDNGKIGQILDAIHQS